MDEIQDFPLQWPLGWQRSSFTQRALVEENKNKVTV